MIATGASALSKQVLGFGGTAFWKILFGVVATGARAARAGRVRAPLRAQVRGLGRDRVAALPLLVVAARPARRARSGTGRARTRSGPGSTSCSRASSRGRRSSPTTRASRATRSAGFWGAGLGYFVPTIPLFALGAVIAMSRHISDAPGLLTAIAAGGAASVLALLALTVDESDEAFANVYSGAVSLQNLAAAACRSGCSSPGPPRSRPVGALLIDLRNYQPFLFLLGSFFVPLFGVLLADWLLAGLPLPAATTSSRRRRCACSAARRLARRLLPLPVALPGRARAGGRGSSRTPIRTRCRGAARRCRASRAAFVLTSAAGLLVAAGPRSRSA